jgi:GNAT superfamily N-acetyltransferase
MAAHRRVAHRKDRFMTLTIRRAVADDLDTIIAFIRALADYEKLPDEVHLDRATLGNHLFGAHPMAEVLIATRDALPIGFALFFHNFSTFEGRPGIYLEDLFVDPAARGSGAGKALLSALAQLAIERGCARLEWSVLDWNEPAIRFYKSLGATAMDGWTINRVDGPALSELAG